ncbi:cytochrome c oxidase subunit I [Pelobacter seleniigenes]|uniref:cytochrome c oxidase subunit I n=1 Tax=Pelobacter seleniigenes TaxID=407188 RepID=UPI000ABC7959|nr:cytochrome c oxidase subunit I [Pelobacter seleniigenes]
MNQMSQAQAVPRSIRTIPEYRGLLSWVSSVDHKQIGIMYLLGALLFLLLGLVEATLIRIQLAVPENTFLSPDSYSQIFTMHGTTMIFLVGMPLMLGLSVYFVPLMIGARDMAFPRLNAFGFWIFLFGGFLLYFSFMSGSAPLAGWFAYAPLNEKAYLFNSGQDYWVIALLLTGAGSIATAINVIVTVFTLRAPGMNFRRLPLFVWMTTINSFLILFALPALNTALVMLFADRQLDALFFVSAKGGSALLWQHYFWFFGHPEVYILILPVFGIISEVIPVFARKPIYGYGFLAGSTVAIAFLSFAVWAHHMFATGLGFPVYYVFAGASMLIAVPTGIKIFNWIATMWGGSIRFTTSMLFATAFLIQFTIGGLSGVAFAAVPIDWQLTDSYFVVAHFHYVLLGGMLFGIISGIYYWYPKMTGHFLSEKLGRAHFWLMIIGFNGTFFVMHLMGLFGMPRRVFTYPADIPYLAPMNMLSSCSAAVLMLSLLIFFANLIVSLYRGEQASDNPWEGWTLEWATSSPPPPHNFDKVPYIRNRRPLWDQLHPDLPEARLEAEHEAGGASR